MMAAWAGLNLSSLLSSHSSHKLLLPAGASGQGHESDGGRGGARADAQHRAGGGLLAMLSPWRHRRRGGYRPGQQPSVSLSPVKPAYVPCQICDQNGVGDRAWCRARHPALGYVHTNDEADVDEGLLKGCGLVDFPEQQVV